MQKLGKMENTLENAIDFADEFVGSNVQLGYKPTTNIPEMLVAYAASVRPDVVVPSEKEIIEKYFAIWPVVESAYHERIREGYRSEVRTQWLLCMDRIKYLNQTMTFTELNNEK